MANKRNRSAARQADAAADVPSDVAILDELDPGGPPSPGADILPAGGTPPPIPESGSPAVPPPQDARVVVMLELPIVRSCGYATTNIDGLPRREATTLRDLAGGLQRENLRLASGRPIRDSRDAIIWILQQLDDARGRK